MQVQIQCNFRIENAGQGYVQDTITHSALTQDVSQVGLHLVSTLWW